MTIDRAAAGPQRATEHGLDGSAGPSTSSAEERDRTADLPDRWGWAAIWATTGVVLATWLPLAWSVLGDNHLGRTTGRMALQIRNLQELGVTGSSWAADWRPYADNPYGHYPPLATILDAILGLLPGFGAYEVVLPQVLLALLAIPSAAFLLRGLGIRWVPTLLAVGLMVVTVYFWAFAPVTFDIGLLIALPAAIVHLRGTASPSRRALVGAAIIALLTTLASWPGVAIAAVLGWWLFARRRFDRVTLIVGASMVLGALISLGYAVGVDGLGELLGRTGDRVSGTGYTVRQYLGRQFLFGTEGLPVWYLVLLPFALVWGLRDRRTRFVAALMTLFAAVWVLVLNDGSYVHSYWAYAVLLPGLVGMGALLDWAYDRLSPRVARAGAVSVGVALVVAFAVMVLGPLGDRHVYGPLDAGRLASANPPSAGQQYAWSTVPAPRWLVYYWDLPPRTASPQALARLAEPADVILVRLDNLPRWLPRSIGAKAVAREGDYVLVRVSDALAAALPPR